jgi:hypothetical protein
MIGKGLTVAALLCLAASPVFVVTRAPVPGTVDPTVTQSNVWQTICEIDYTKSIRPPTEWSQALKQRLLIEQRLPGKVQDYELDHLLPLRLGGHPTSANNLWLQTWPDAAIKEQAEMRLYREVCAGRMTLEQAQNEIRQTWGKP